MKALGKLRRHILKLSNQQFLKGSNIRDSIQKRRFQGQ